MSRKTLLFVIVGALAVIAAGLSLYILRPRPTHLTGDAWDYTLLPNEVADGWKLRSQGIITPHDLTQESLETNTNLTQSVSLLNMTQLYYAAYQPPEQSLYFDLTLQVILYAAEAEAAAAFAPENPGVEWEPVAVAQVGDEGRAWRYLNPDPTLNQNIYRIDFRFLNGIASVTMLGATEALPNLDEPLAYARLIHQKMLTHPTPGELQRLERAHRPDLRAALLTQTQLVQVDDYLGGRWQMDSRLLPGWTATAAFNPESQSTLQRLGRVTGYQMFLVKALSQAEQTHNFPAGLFQQVTLYGQADAAGEALGYMVGLEQFPEREPSSKVGDEARAWSGLLESTTNAGVKITVAVTEIDFRVGTYIGSIRLQTRPLTPAELADGQASNEQLALTLAQRLAANFLTQSEGG